MLTNAVPTTNGPILGVEQGAVRAFKGIPFATARRFAKATPPPRGRSRAAARTSAVLRRSPGISIMRSRSPASA